MPVQQPQTALSMDYFIGRILSRFGASNRRVEIKGLDMAEVIAEDTLPLYSKFFPWEYVGQLRAEDRLPETTGFYYLNAPTPVMSVSRLLGGLDTRSGMSGMTRASAVRQADINIAGSGIAFSLVEALEQNDVNAVASLPVTTVFHPPRTVEISPKGDYDGAAVVINCMHPVTLHTIPWNMHDEFLQRALTDVCVAIRGIRRKFGRINTIYGEIELSMEDIDREAEKAPEIEEKWRTWAPRRANRRKWYVG